MKHAALMLLALAFPLVEKNFVLAQFVGSIGGADEDFLRDQQGFHLKTLKPDVALNYITVDGTVETRIPAEEIRIVLAVMSEATTASECQTMGGNQIKSLLAEWKELKIPEENIVEDFINVLPRYEWRQENRDGEKIGIQKRVGYRMQMNLHLSVKTESQAMEAIKRSFKHGVTDIVSVDYWSSQLNTQKLKAQQAAIAIAKKKADSLLGVFDKKPKVFNIQEKTVVFFPRSMYRTIDNALEETVTYSYKLRDIPRIKAYRPKMTFLDGVKIDADVRPTDILMQSEIAIVSLVRLYYQTPVEKVAAIKAP